VFLSGPASKSDSRRDRGKRGETGETCETGENFDLFRCLIPGLKANRIEIQ